MSDSLIYHYCSAQSFFSILKSNTIRLSSLKESNDSLEGNVLHYILQHKYYEYSIEPQLASYALNILNSSSLTVTDCFAACFSKNEDMLSQWRAYASDGTGFAIGFDVEALGKLINEKYVNCKILDVNYNLNALIDQFRPIITSWTHTNPIQGGDIYSIFRNDIFSSWELFYGTKLDAFSEEQEIRLATSRINYDANGLDFIPREDKIVPFIPFVFKPDHMQDASEWPVRKVIMGPKNKTDFSVLASFINSCMPLGFSGTFSISKSSASYR